MPGCDRLVPLPRPWFRPRVAPPVAPSVKSQILPADSATSDQAPAAARASAIAGKFSDYGIEDNFMRLLAEKLKPNTSALFVLARGGVPERVLPEVGKYGGTVLHTSLPPETEDQLRAALTSGPEQEARGTAV